MARPCPRAERPCRSCGTPLSWRHRADAQFCSTACRMTTYRWKKRLRDAQQRQPEAMVMEYVELAGKESSGSEGYDWLDHHVQADDDVFRTEWDRTVKCLQCGR